MRTGSSCNVRNVYRKSQPVRISMGIKVNWCLRPTLQITKFQAFSALKSKLGRHIDRVGCLGRTLRLVSSLAIEKKELNKD